MTGKKNPTQKKNPNQQTKKLSPSQRGNRRLSGWDNICQLTDKQNAVSPSLSILLMPQKWTSKGKGIISASLHFIYIYIFNFERNAFVQLLFLIPFPISRYPGKCVGGGERNRKKKGGVVKKGSTGRN